MFNETDAFPPDVTPADMSLLLSGLVSIFKHMEGLAATLGSVDAQLDDISAQLKNIPSPIPIPVTIDPMKDYLAELEAFKAGLPGALVTNPPQIHGGINTIRLSDDTELGRIYCDDQTSSVYERFLVKAAAGFREASTLRYIDVNVDPMYSDARKADSHDLGTGFTHANQPASVFSSSTYTVTGVPESGTGAPPSGVYRRYYKITRVAGTPPTETAAGELYREWFVNPAGDEVWVDHWVLYPAYLPPDAPNNRHVRIDKQSTGIPASADAFFQDVQTFMDDHPGTYSYCYLQLEWKAFDV